jgi:RNA polymerase sigma-70 factor (ECF subfamily)
MQPRNPAKNAADRFDSPGFLNQLRDGEPEAYRALIRRFHGSMVGVAASIIGSRAQAEEVVQDSWLAVYTHIAKFEGRSSLSTWLFTIVLNRARTRATSESRTVGLPGLTDGAGPGRTDPATAFKPDGHWVEIPRLWDVIDPERIVAGRQIFEHVQAEIERLPAGQRAVLWLRDIEGQEADATCELLGISSENQRVLLHRARARIRARIDRLVGKPAGIPAKAATPAKPNPLVLFFLARRWRLV